MSTKITMLKPGIVELSIGTGVVKSLQDILGYFANTVPKDEMEEYKDLFKKGTMPDEFPKQWMKHVFNITVLLKTIQDTAMTQGLTYDKDIEAPDFKIEDLMKE